MDSNMVLVNKYIVYIRDYKRYSLNTINGYSRDIRDFILFINNEDIRYVSDDRFREYLRYLYSNYSNKSTISRKISSIRAFYNYLVLKGLTKKNFFREVKVPKRKRDLPNFLTTEEVEALINVSVSDIYGDRDRLVLELLYGTGVRVSELINIRLRDINMDDRSIRIMGKGNKERIVLYGRYADEALGIYLDNSYRVLNKKGSEFLLLNKNGDRISDRYIRKIIEKLARECDISKGVSPHTLRHTFATDMLNNGADLISVKDLMGHNSINTTSIYTHITDDHIRNVYKQAFPRAESEESGGKS